MNTKELMKVIKCGGFDEILREIYQENGLAKARARYIDAIMKFEAQYGEGRENVQLFSCPGRSEISGNHTDHNGGKVIASSVGCDMIAVAAPSKEKKINVRTEGFKEDTLSLPIEEADKYVKYKSASLIAGMCKACENHGFKYGAFDAFTISNVPKGSGLSSSAAFEVLIGKIIDSLFNDNAIGNVELAKYAQFAENVYFGKPCGLMDQMACAVGGIITIDFENKDEPKIEKVDFDLNENGYSLVIINTGGSHSDLNDEYASIPFEMKSVAAKFGKEQLRGITREEILSRYAALRSECKDRALLRALHFIDENERVDEILCAMKNEDVEGFLKGVAASGDSSWRFLQNVCQSRDPSEQGIATAIMLSEHYFKKNKVKGVCRVHGGGFAGTAQAFVPSDDADDFCRFIDSIMGEGSALNLCIRKLGAVAFG